MRGYCKGCTAPYSCQIVITTLLGPENIWGNSFGTAPHLSVGHLCSGGLVHASVITGICNVFSCCLLHRPMATTSQSTRPSDSAIRKVFKTGDVDLISLPVMMLQAVLALAWSSAGPPPYLSAAQLLDSPLCCMLAALQAGPR